MTAEKTAPAGTAGAGKASGAAGTGNAVARRGDLVVIHLRHRDWQDGQPREYDDFWLGQVTSVTRAGLVRLYRPPRLLPGQAGPPASAAGGPACFFTSAGG